MASETDTTSRRELLRGIALVGGSAVTVGACSLGAGSAADAGIDADARTAPDAGTDCMVDGFDIRAFGAIGDGATDDTAAIQAALDAAADSVRGGVVRIPQGVYLITNSLIVGAMTRVLGDGAGISVLRGAAGSYSGKSVNGNYVYATIACVAIDHSSVEKLTVDHATNGTWANGIAFVPDGADAGGTVCTYCTVRDCEVLGFPAHEYLIWNHRGRHIKILDNFVDGRVPSLDPLALSQEGIESFGGYDVLIRGNTVLRVGNAAINLGAADGFSNAECVGIQVVANYIEAANMGVHLGTAQNGNDPQNLSHLHISNNVIRNCWEQGIHLTTSAPATTITDVRITGNSIAHAKTAITLYGHANETTHTGIVVRNNTITETASLTGGAIAAFFFPNLVIADNSVTGSANIGLFLHRLENAVVSGNIIDSTQRNAINAHLCSNLRIINNQFYRYNELGAQPGVLLTSLARGSACGNTFYAENDGVAIVVDSNSDEVRLTDNALLDASTGSVPFGNFGTNPNCGIATVTAGETSADVLNTLATAGCRFNVTQDTGDVVAFRVSHIPGGFRITLATTSLSAATFRWEILQ